MIGHSRLNLKDIRFIGTDILGYSPVGRGNCRISTCNALRDETQQPAYFERICFPVVRKVFFGTTKFFVTLDDDLFGARATNNQVKTFSNRKSHREGNRADVIADSSFRISMALRFRRRGEKIESSVENLIQMVFKGLGEQALNSLTVTADRGYGKESLTTKLANGGSSSIVVLPDHWFRCHPFVRRWYFKIDRDDDIVEREQGKDGDANELSGSVTELTEAYQRNQLMILISIQTISLTLHGTKTQSTV